MKQFFKSLNSIEMSERKSASCFEWAIICLKTHLNFVFLLLIPIVSYEEVRYGWHKLLNCSQIVTLPLITTFIMCKCVAITKERSQFLFPFPFNFFQISFPGNRRSNTFRILFWCLAWDSNTGFSSNKPTHYLLDHGDLKGCNGHLCMCIDWRVAVHSYDICNNNYAWLFRVFVLISSYIFFVVNYFFFLFCCCCCFFIFSLFILLLNFNFNSDSNKIMTIQVQLK